MGCDWVVWALNWGVQCSALEWVGPEVEGEVGVLFTDHSD